MPPPTASRKATPLEKFFVVRHFELYYQTYHQDVVCTKKLFGMLEMMFDSLSKPDFRILNQEYNELTLEERQNVELTYRRKRQMVE